MLATFLTLASRSGSIHPTITRRRLSGISRATLIGLFVGVAAISSGQDVTEPALKAAYIYNFALFTDWPPEPSAATAPFVICVVGDTAVGDALDRDIKGRTLAGRNITISRMAAGAQQRACHVLYLSGMKPSQAAQAVAAFRDLPVLTLSDLDSFTEQGGIAQFYFEHGQLRFTVDVASAKRARLQISSRLLALSKRK